MKGVSGTVVAEFVRACREAARHGLVRCSSGNLSMRVDARRMLIKPSRHWMERTSKKHISLCRLADGARLAGPAPSVEIGFHAGVLRCRPDVNVVMHFQSPCATALACRARPPASHFVIPEVPFYIGPIAWVPFLPPGSPELAVAVTNAMRDHDLVVMRHHGLVTAAADVDHLLQKAVFFELACEIILRSGESVTFLPVKAVRALLDARKPAVLRAADIPSTPSRPKIGRSGHRLLRRDGTV